MPLSTIGLDTAKSVFQVHGVDALMERGELSKVTPTEKLILDDIRERTGLSFPHVQSARPVELHGARAVYPILAEWVPQVDENHRHAIYSCFDTPFSYGFLDQLIGWWQAEEYDLGRSCLTQIIARLAQVTDAQRLWDLTRCSEDIPDRFMLLARLAGFPQVQREVKEVLVRALDDPRTKVGDLQQIAKVDDPRIRDWFARQVGSPNRALRTIAKRVGARRKPLPRGIAYPVPQPDRKREITSTEIDIDEYVRTVRELIDSYKLTLSTAIRSGRFLSSLEVDHWAVVRTFGCEGESLGLWFRLEDVDVVEIVLAPDAASGSTAEN